MSKEDKIKEWTEFAMTHLSDIIPYNIQNYDEVLLDEAKYYAEVMYEFETNPEGYKNIKSEPLLDIGLKF
jgi:hypothetical protein